MTTEKRFQKVGPQAKFDPAEFAKAIQSSGIDFKWSRAVTCPCHWATSDHPDPECTRCYGDGWWYVSPVGYDEREALEATDNVAVRALFSVMGSSLKGSRSQVIGAWDSGEGVITFPAASQVAYMDRFVSLDQVMAQSQVLIRGAGDIVEVGRVGRTTEEATRAMNYSPLRINWLATESTVFVPRVDFRIIEPQSNQPARLLFQAGRGPSEGERFVVHYNCHPIWIVTEAVYGNQTLRGPEEGQKGPEAPRNLPLTFKVALDFLVRQSGGTSV